jgi:hypothetical protein
MQLVQPKCCIIEMLREILGKKAETTWNISVYGVQHSPLFRAGQRIQSRESVKQKEFKTYVDKL